MTLYNIPLVAELYITSDWFLVKEVCSEQFLQFTYILFNACFVSCNFMVRSKKWMNSVLAWQITVRLKIRRNMISLFYTSCRRDNVGTVRVTWKISITERFHFVVTTYYGKRHFFRMIFYMLKIGFVFFTVKTWSSVTLFSVRFCYPSVFGFVVLRF